MSMQPTVKRPRGRPVRITREIVERVAELMMAGSSTADAVAIAANGVSFASFRSAVSREPLKTIYQRAKAVRLDGWLKRIETEGRRGAGGIMWLLERTHRERFGTSAPREPEAANQIIVGLDEDDIKRARSIAMGMIRKPE